MKLHELKKIPGNIKKAKRIGRGNGSNKGNYSTKGMKGQNARSGASSPAWFEGNQTPLYMRLPKRKGFKRYYKHVKKFTPVSLERIVGVNFDAPVITKELLVTHGLIHSVSDPVKILGSASLSNPLSFEGIDAFSVTAKESVLQAGGTIG